MYIVDALKKISKQKLTLFTTPGHSQGKVIGEDIKKLIGSKPFNLDFSEIEGLDNLQHPEGIIFKSLNWASQLYQSKASFYLVNGSSSGIIAIMLSVIKEGDKVLIARNAHKSVINSLILTGSNPLWINTEWLNEWDIPGPVNPRSIEASLNINNDIKVVWITSPTYEGVVSDIAAISKVCHKFNIPLIVDEAHGALWNFSDKLPNTAIQLGADASVQSLHKTASCLTQGAILHLGINSRIEPAKIQQSLNIINTTSPSYILLASIESSIEYLNSNKGQKKLDKLLENIDNFKQKLQNNCAINFLQDSASFKIDKTKICFSLEKISGFDLAEFTELEAKLEVELCNNSSIMALTGIGTDNKNLKILADTVILAQNKIHKKKKDKLALPFVIPETVLSPREAFYSEKDKINIKDSVGKISGEIVVPYPPGIPILIPGEIINEFHLELIDKNEIFVIK